RPGADHGLAADRDRTAGDVRQPEPRTEAGAGAAGATAASAASTGALRARPADADDRRHASAAGSHASAAACHDRRAAAARPAAAGAARRGAAARPGRHAGAGRGPAGLAARITALATPLYLAACAIPSGGLFRPAKFRDIHIYREYGDAFLAGHVPYRDF